MYAELAWWFHLVTAPADCADKAADVVRMLADRGVVLDIGLGAGGRAGIRHEPRPPVHTSRATLRTRKYGSQLDPHQKQQDETRHALVVAEAAASDDFHTDTSGDGTTVFHDGLRAPHQRDFRMADLNGLISRGPLTKTHFRVEPGAT